MPPTWVYPSRPMPVPKLWNAQWFSWSVSATQRATSFTFAASARGRFFEPLTTIAFSFLLPMTAPRPARPAMSL